MNVYDFDKTIYQNDSSADLLLWCMKKKPHLFFSWFPKAVKGSFDHYIRKKDKESMKEKFFSLLASFPQREKLIEEFWDEHEKGIQSFYLKQKREDDLIISASPAFLIEPICRRLHIRCLASPLDLRTLSYQGRNCYGEEKLRRLREYTDERIDRFYSDSLSDTPLAEAAKKAYFVKNGKVRDWPQRRMHEQAQK